MKVFVTAMMLWISQHTGYTVPELPTVVELTPFELKRFAYDCDDTPIPNGNEDICSVEEYWDLDEWERENIPLALYDHYEQTIVVRNTVNTNKRNLIKIILLDRLDLHLHNL